ncbi:low temperature requirement protein A [Herbiconiux sp. CPCC 203407]|uniref:Low temperature requirement protein A n=1 Tax=Herbiconiux oxytropis TaxID=2970915 RepID=A0AA42BTM3_9MICO|nr:low temperature requirement protein A [Herbiconiux oxytropis]MCS5721427.1 low temperature requirement protein A [Herbiconiux oxytropis]MCS5724504.1 low temperature requirement protein A [Herbiconiux oxytropis]
MTRQLLPFVRMRGRDVDEPGRVSSPLELLFDLTFVVAIASIVTQLAHAIAEDHIVTALPNFLMVFFAIWWAWLNFTWFASAYDTDDVPYRLLTMLQMGGVLVLAAGVPSAFEHGDYLLITTGYFIMRIALVVQWLRAAAQDPAGRATALRYALGITVVQALWIVRVFTVGDWPFAAQVAVFALLAVCEMAVPIWAERPRATAWHPHHVAERYALFTIILLGESVLAATSGVQSIVSAGASSGEFVLLAAAGLALLFGLWWVYFLEPAHEGLENNRRWSYYWGYGHYLIFVALAAVGAGLEVSVEALAHHAETPVTTIGYAVAVPVALFLVMMRVLYRPLIGPTVVPPALSLGGAAVVLLAPLVAPATSLAVVVLAITVVVALVVTLTIVVRRPRPEAAPVS